MIREELLDDGPGADRVGEEVVQLEHPRAVSSPQAPSPRKGGMPLPTELPAPMKAVRGFFDIHGVVLSSPTPEALVDMSRIAKYHSSW